MHYDEYVENVKRLTMNFDVTRPGAPTLIHAALGIGGEAGEVVDLVKKYCGGRIEDRAELISALKEEVGDLLWYVALLLSNTDLTLGEVLDANVAKLDKRYFGSITIG
jgi:NTP pyrophosphatase (non-canonical NTP hydrolase)